MRNSLNYTLSDSLGLYLAEKEGFEPPVELPLHRISSAARSTTLAFFRCKIKDGIQYLEKDDGLVKFTEWSLDNG